LSVEEANKIRKSMGLAPLPVPGAAPASGPSFKESEAGEDDGEEPASTFETRAAAAYSNWENVQREAEAKKRQEEKKRAIIKERERAARTAKLQGKGLADEADEEDDMAWLRHSSKRQKKIQQAERMQKELEERERQAQAALEYNDLSGLKVAHEVKDFDDGADHILVLKDTAVDQDSDDELEAVAIKEKERLEERLNLKKRKHAYDPNDDGGAILAQYDEEIDGKKRKAFTLDGQGRAVEQQGQTANAGTHRKVAISLDILKDDTPSNDYMDVEVKKIKKPKKSKSKSKARKRLDDEDDLLAFAPEDEDVKMQLDDEPRPRPKKDLSNQSFVDDDFLQDNLAASRLKALKKRKKTRPEDLARALREEAAEPNIHETIEEDEPGLIIDETTEFVQNLDRSKSDEAEEEARRKRRKSSHVSNGVPSVVGTQSVDAEGDVNMEQPHPEADAAEEHRGSREPSAKVTITGLDEEETVDGGLGATLKLLKQRGVIRESDASELNTHYRERQKFLADKQRAEAQAERLAKEQRERERLSGRWNNMSAREREEWARKNNINREQMESRKLADIFNKEYKPNVQLTYVDEFGREMNQKEAFKQLSHQFHGKGSGNTKTQKHLDKIAAEKKKLAESSLETTLAGGMSSAQGQQSKKHKQAGVRL
ncbi:hypothetical protein M011DRAFT_384672, partial [Sporormia fimetaria CBS 119925]